MQNAVLDIAKELSGSDLIDSRVSFKGFINFLKERKLHEKTMKVKYLDFVIHHFEDRLAGVEQIDPRQLGQYEDLLELIYSTIFPAIEDEQDNLWALAVPIKPLIFYGTEAFYDLLRDPVSHEMKVCLIDKELQERNKINFELVYSIILKRLYGYDYTPAKSLIRAFRNLDTGLMNFFQLNIDTRFIEVFPKGELPALDPKLFHTHPTRPEVLTYLMQHLPLTGFRFEGFSAITVTEITSDYAIESIKGLILSPGGGNNGARQEEVIRYLKIMSGKKEIEFGLQPFLEINGQPVFSSEICMHSVLAEMAASDQMTEATYLSMAEDYLQNPHLIYYETLPPYQAGEPFYLEALRKEGIVSFAVVPVYYNNKLAGVLEASAREEGVLDHTLLSRVDRAIPLLAQLLRRSIDEFNDQIKNIIKENFTSIQPAVEWMFNEAAWRYEQQLEQGEENPAIETIYFKDVYPLYGAVDIRNSTIERNNALRKDLQVQFDLLIRTLEELQRLVTLGLLEELIYQSRKWQEALSGVLTTADEMNLNAFLREKIQVFFDHFKHSRPDTAAAIERYMLATDEAEGVAFANRRDLEATIQLINKTINQHLDEATLELQKSYPVYFEKFRTDGVEYDIYIGQSIVPNSPFDLLYLRNLRLWQLKSMAFIARQTQTLLPQMTEKLATTQLIFVHSTSIDISFRKDERRFDVEGGYNIRYQVVKKRIDKVHVQGTNERLTQPGKIAIIYLNDKEAEEYVGYIRYLQEKGILAEGVENLELEELQGVSGLKALRVGVKMLSVGTPAVASPVERMKLA